MPFAVGDVVMLRSGGPRMTVTYIGDDGMGQTTVSCCWFDGGKPANADYPPAALQSAA
jgi:uncharacterized protein YodC (DUF2158 family)